MRLLPDEMTDRMILGHRIQKVAFDDFHAAALTEYSDVPSVSTRLGETDSLGRTLSMKLARRFKLPTIVSWSLPGEFDDFSSTIEREVISAILEKKPRSVVRP